MNTTFETHGQPITQTIIETISNYLLAIITWFFNNIYSYNYYQGPDAHYTTVARWIRKIWFGMFNPTFGQEEASVTNSTSISVVYTSWSVPLFTIAISLLELFVIAVITIWILLKCYKLCFVVLIKVVIPIVCLVFCMPYIVSFSIEFLMYILGIENAYLFLTWLALTFLIEIVLLNLFNVLRVIFISFYMLIVYLSISFLARVFIVQGFDIPDIAGIVSNKATEGAILVSFTIIFTSLIFAALCSCWYWAARRQVPKCNWGSTENSPSIVPRVAFGPTADLPVDMFLDHPVNAQLLNLNLPHNNFRYEIYDHCPFVHKWANWARSQDGFDIDGSKASVKDFLKRTLLAKWQTLNFNQYICAQIVDLVVMRAAVRPAHVIHSRILLNSREALVDRFFTHYPSLYHPQVVPFIAAIPLPLLRFLCLRIGSNPN